MLGGEPLQSLSVQLHFAPLSRSPSSYTTLHVNEGIPSFSRSCLIKLEISHFLVRECNRNLVRDDYFSWVPCSRGKLGAASRASPPTLLIVRSNLSSLLSREWTGDHSKVPAQCFSTSFICQIPVEPTKVCYSITNFAEPSLRKWIILRMWCHLLVFLHCTHFFSLKRKIVTFAADSLPWHNEGYWGQQHS